MKHPPLPAWRVPLSAPQMHGDELMHIQEAIADNWIAPMGRYVDSFEDAIAMYTGAGHAIALSSGTAALHLSVKLAGAGLGDVVLCSDLTFIASVNPICYEGATPVFIDAERETWNMDPAALEKALLQYGSRVKAVIATDLYGTPAQLDLIAALCSAYQIPLIEDAAESLGATYRQKQAGTFGTYGILSFNGNKIITTSGGGILLLDGESDAERAVYLAAQAKEPTPWYEHRAIGYNYRMSNILAAIGCGQMAHLDAHIAKKRSIFRQYQEAFASLPVTLNPASPHAAPTYWLSCLLIDPGCPVSPGHIIAALSARSIESRPFWKPMHLQPVYRHCGYVAISGGVSGDLFARGLCLPSSINMTCDQQEMVIDIVRKCFD